MAIVTLFCYQQRFFLVVSSSSPLSPSSLPSLLGSIVPYQTRNSRVLWHYVPLHRLAAKELSPSYIVRSLLWRLITHDFDCNIALVVHLWMEFHCFNSSLKILCSSFTFTNRAWMALSKTPICLSLAVEVHVVITIFYYLRDEENFVAQETLARRKQICVAQTRTTKHFRCAKLLSTTISTIVA